MNYLKRLIGITSFSLMLLLFSMNSAFATVTASGSCGSATTWELDDSGTLTISGTGSISGYSSASSVPWYSYRNSIISVIIEDSISHIGRNTFLNHSKLSSIYLPDSITEIDYPAFTGCSKLKEVHISDLESWFSILLWGIDANPLCNGGLLYIDGTPLASISVPSSVTSIDDFALSGCGLTSISIPGSVVEIGGSAFRGCANLESVYLSEGLSSIWAWAF